METSPVKRRRTQSPDKGLVSVTYSQGNLSRERYATPLLKDNENNSEDDGEQNRLKPYPSEMNILLEAAIKDERQQTQRKSRKIDMTDD